MVSRTLSQRHMPDDKQVVFASTFDYTKLIHYDTSTGYIDVGGFPGILLHPEVPRKAWLPEGLARSAGYDAMPVDALGPSTRLIKLHPYIDLFFWMYDYANVLHREASMRLLHKRLPFSRGICLFPQAGENISTCITRGIRVKASPLFVPELSHSDDSKEVYFFAYSIEFKLLDEVTQLEEQEISGYREAPLKSVQLLDRRWITRNNEGEIESEVFGGGVIGEYPILVAGGGAFVYQSCTHIRNGIGGTMEGEFTFVEEPGTRQIQAKCDPFMLRQPRACF